MPCPESSQQTDAVKRLATQSDLEAVAEQLASHYARALHALRAARAGDAQQLQALLPKMRQELVSVHQAVKDWSGTIQGELPLGIAGQPAHKRQPLQQQPSPCQPCEDAKRWAFGGGESFPKHLRAVVAVWKCGNGHEHYHSGGLCPTVVETPGSIAPCGAQLCFGGDEYRTQEQT